MIRHVAGQAALALAGIALVFAILFRLAAIETPVEMVEAPTAGGRYVEAVFGFSETINPILAPALVQANPVDQDLGALLFEGLTRLDATGLVSPSLATDWQVSEDGTIYDFQLRQGVTWHDGAPFTAADVAFTVQAMQDPGYQGNAALQDLWSSVTVEVVDDHAVRFGLSQPLPSFLFYTTIGILPAHLLSNVPAADLPAHSFSTRAPVGTGPFQVESVALDRVSLTAYPGYWGAKPYLQGVEFLFFGDRDTILAAYGRGEVDGFAVEQPAGLPALAELPDLQLYTAQTARYELIFLNLQQETTPYFQVKEVRQALFYALDRQLLIDRVLAGQGLVADSPILPTTWAYDPGAQRYGYDPERAIGLLDESGWVDSDGDRIRDKEGVSLEFDLLTGDDPAMAELAEEIATQWQAVGVAATVRPVEGAMASNLIRQRAFSAALAEIALTADPDPYPLWHSTQANDPGQNYGGFVNEAADQVMEQGRLAMDLERRAALYRSFQQIFCEEVPALLIHYPTYAYAVDAGVHGVQLAPLLHSSDRFRNIADWYLGSEPALPSANEQFDKSGD